MSAAATAVGAEVVKTTTGVPMTAGIWTVVLLLGLAIIKQWGPWRDAASKGRDADFGRLREDVKEIKEEAQRASKAAQRLENMVACMRPAITILTAEVKRLDPNSASNPALLQVNELMAMAAVGDFGVGLGTVNLATFKGTGE